MVITLIVNREGFPFRYETFDGHRADVSTRETILRMVERQYGKARRVWVFDRGMVSEEKLAAIRKRGGPYLGGTPRSQRKQLEAELAQDDGRQVRPEVEVKKVVNDLYEVSLRHTAEGVRWSGQMKEDRKNGRESREAAYLRRTNLPADTAEELCSKYLQLTEAEASFRTPKSELSLRPLFPPKEARVQVHVRVACLGYALWVTLKHLLQRRAPLEPKPPASGVENAQPFTPMRALALLATLPSADMVLPPTDAVNSVCAASRSQPPNRNLCFTSWPWRFQIASKTSTNVV